MSSVTSTLQLTPSIWCLFQIPLWEADSVEYNHLYLPFSIDCSESVFMQRSAIKANKQNQAFQDMPVFISISHASEARQIWALEITRSLIAQFFISPPQNCFTETLRVEKKKYKMLVMFFSSKQMPVGSHHTLGFFKS